MFKNYILQEELNILNNNQKNLENLLFKIISQLCPCIKFFHRLYTDYLFLSFPNLREGEFDNKMIYLNQQFAKITGNALINNLFNNNINNSSKEIKLEENFNLL
jgi:hypothetical protein